MNPGTIAQFRIAIDFRAALTSNSGDAKEKGERRNGREKHACCSKSKAHEHWE